MPTSELEDLIFTIPQIPGAFGDGNRNSSQYGLLGCCGGAGQTSVLKVLYRGEPVNAKAKVWFCMHGKKELIPYRGITDLQM